MTNNEIDEGISMWNNINQNPEYIEYDYRMKFALWSISQLNGNTLNDLIAEQDRLLNRFLFFGITLIGVFILLVIL